MLMDQCAGNRQSQSDTAIFRVTGGIQPVKGLKYALQLFFRNALPVVTDPDQQRVVYQPVTVEPREVTPRIVREENYGDVENA